MLAANVCSADFCRAGASSGAVPWHEGPTPEKQDILRGYLKAMGVGISISDDPSRSSSHCRGHQDRPMRSRSRTMLLRSRTAGDLHAHQQWPLWPGGGLHYFKHQPIRRYHLTC